MNIHDISIAEPTPKKEPEKNSVPLHMEEVLHELKHYLPAQAPLKDFIHHNTLHAFQNLKFNAALRMASGVLGYNVSLSLTEYRSLFEAHRIKEDVLDRVLRQRKGADQFKEWRHKLLYTEYRNTSIPRIGTLRANWKKYYRIDLDSLVHSTLFRITGSYLDQGIAIWNFPVHKEFLASVREVERNSFSSFFRTTRARKLLLNKSHTLEELLAILVGDKSLYKHYLFDQQFAHQGWSGIVSTIEDQPHTLLDSKKISLRDFIFLELLLEIDSLDYQFGKTWKPLSDILITEPTQDLFAPLPHSELHEVLILWQEAFEWSYYDQVLSALTHTDKEEKRVRETTFQAMFCLDDRECSLRRYLEKTDPACETFGTPGFFSVEFFFKAAHGKFYTKLCPAPLTPNYLIKELETKGKRAQKDPYFTKHSHTLFSGWLITQTLGFWSAFKLFLSIFKPAASPATATSFNHMDKVARLTIENKHGEREDDLQVGFTIPEMADRVENLLRSIGLVKNFAPVIYVVGHGSSSVNNPHYAAYDCGACSGRPGSVNARAFSYMANHMEVRENLQTRGIKIPETTHFVGGLHDTSRDEIAFYDEDQLPVKLSGLHNRNVQVFHRALQLNAKERSRRFDSINTKSALSKIHRQVKKRSVSLFEPRPELNHATNALCIVGRRSLTKNVFLDRRAFLNSYDHAIDPEGKSLLSILKAAAPVCGGINLEYFFSRVDNQKLGAGTKLPHNVMGLFGVANGIEGDLRPGLPSQMIEVHDPIRLLIIVDHFHEIVLRTIQQHTETYEWFKNDWVYLVTKNPETGKLHLFRDEAFVEYHPLQTNVGSVADITFLIEETEENIPAHLITLL
jgi:uncharacterized protein YbcC (UPF0753/DUF2309 family)